MYRTVIYSLFFVVVVALQYFLFDNINFGSYIYPFIYISFILLLPSETPTVNTLFMGLALGLILDFFMGTAGLHTIPTLFTAFSRRLLLGLLFGREEVADGFIPTSRNVGMGKFIQYVSIAVLVHSAIFFMFETLSFRFFYNTLLKIVASTLFTTILISFAQLLLLQNQGRTRQT